MGRPQSPDRAQLSSPKKRSDTADRTLGRSHSRNRRPHNRGHAAVSLRLLTALYAGIGVKRPAHGRQRLKWETVHHQVLKLCLTALYPVLKHSIHGTMTCRVATPSCSQQKFSSPLVYCHSVRNLRLGSMMTTSNAQIYLDTNRTIAPISPWIFGGFVEHMGRCVYEGIYDPQSPLADERGLRTDVLDALREQKYTIMRYPGGNFLSGYNWLDGVGPKDERPRRRELAWQSIETNQFGTNEFMEFCSAIDAEPMLGVNMGTGTIQSAADLSNTATRRRHLLGRSARPTRPSRAVRRKDLVRGQRDGRSVADRPSGYARICQESPRSRQDDEVAGPVDQDSPLRFIQQPDADLSGVGPRLAGNMLGARRLSLDPLLCEQPRRRHHQLSGHCDGTGRLRRHHGSHAALRQGQTTQPARRLPFVGRMAGLVYDRTDARGAGPKRPIWRKKSTPSRMRWSWRSGSTSSCASAMC